MVSHRCLPAGQLNVLKSLIFATASPAPWSLLSILNPIPKYLPQEKDLIVGDLVSSQCYKTEHHRAPKSHVSLIQKS